VSGPGFAAAALLVAVVALLLVTAGVLAWQAWG
jgi:hypothetical protein